MKPHNSGEYNLYIIIYTNFKFVTISAKFIQLYGLSDEYSIRTKRIQMENQSHQRKNDRPRYLNLALW